MSEVQKRANPFEPGDFLYDARRNERNSWGCLNSFRRARALFILAFFIGLLLSQPATAKWLELDDTDRAYLKAIQDAVRRDDRRWLAEQTAHKTEGHGDTIVDVGIDEKVVADFIKNYDTLMSPYLRCVILSQKPDKLFERDIGVMVGRGDLWFGESFPKPDGTETDGRVIIAISNELCPELVVETCRQYCPAAVKK